MQDLNALPLDALFDELTRDGSLRRLVEACRAEDLGPSPGGFDATSVVCIDERAAGTARIAVRGAGVLAGMRTVPAVLEGFAPGVRFEPRAADGERVEVGAVAGVLRGPLRQILGAERTLLNLLGRLSGVATRTAEFVAAAREGGPSLEVLDTRKTTPGLRHLEKYAVRCGGGRCHRLGLYDAVLIKDNHLAHVPLDSLADHLKGVTARARAVAAERGGLRFIEVEVDRLEQLDRILVAGGCGVDIVLLDNMTMGQIATAVALRNKWGVRVRLEVSGGVDLASIGAIARTGVDRVSVGALTHHAVSLDVALDVDQRGEPE